MNMNETTLTKSSSSIPALAPPPNRSRSSTNADTSARDKRREQQRQQRLRKAQRHKHTKGKQKQRDDDGLVNVKGDYAPSRKTLGLELIADPQLLAKNNDWRREDDNDNASSTTGQSPTSNLNLVTPVEQLEKRSRSRSTGLSSKLGRQQQQQVDDDYTALMTPSKDTSIISKDESFDAIENAYARQGQGVGVGAPQFSPAVKAAELQHQPPGLLTPTQKLQQHRIRKLGVSSKDTLPRTASSARLDADTPSSSSSSSSNKESTIKFASDVKPPNESTEKSPVVLSAKQKRLQAQLLKKKQEQNKKVQLLRPPPPKSPSEDKIFGDLDEPFDEARGESSFNSNSSSSSNNLSLDEPLSSSDDKPPALLSVVETSNSTSNNVTYTMPDESTLPKETQDFLKSKGLESIRAARAGRVRSFFKGRAGGGSRNNSKSSSSAQSQPNHAVEVSSSEDESEVEVELKQAPPQVVKSKGKGFRSLARKGSSLMKKSNNKGHDNSTSSAAGMNSKNITNSSNQEDRSGIDNSPLLVKGNDTYDEQNSELGRGMASFMNIKRNIIGNIATKGAPNNSTNPSLTEDDSADNTHTTTRGGSNPILAKNGSDKNEGSSSNSNADAADQFQQYGGDQATTQSSAEPPPLLLEPRLSSSHPPDLTSSYMATTSTLTSSKQLKSPADIMDRHAQKTVAVRLKKQAEEQKLKQERRKKRLEMQEQEQQRQEVLRNQLLSTNPTLTFDGSTTSHSTPKSPGIMLARASPTPSPTLPDPTIRDYFCTPTVSSSQIHLVEEPASVACPAHLPVMAGMGMGMAGMGHGRLLTSGMMNNATEASTPIVPMKRVISNESPTGVGDLDKSPLGEPPSLQKSQQQSQPSPVRTMPELTTLGSVATDLATTRLVPDKYYNMRANTPLSALMSAPDTPGNDTWNSEDTERTTNTCNTSSEKKLTEISEDVLKNSEAKGIDVSGSFILGSANGEEVALEEFEMAKKEGEEALINKAVEDQLNDSGICSPLNMTAIASDLMCLNKLDWLVHCWGSEYSSSKKNEEDDVDQGEILRKRRKWKAVKEAAAKAVVAEAEEAAIEAERGATAEDGVDDKGTSDEALASVANKSVHGSIALSNEEATDQPLFNASWDGLNTQSGNNAMAPGKKLEEKAAGGNFGESEQPLFRASWDKCDTENQVKGVEGKDQGRDNVFVAKSKGSPQRPLFNATWDGKSNLVGPKRVASKLKAVATKIAKSASWDGSSAAPSEEGSQYSIVEEPNNTSQLSTSNIELHFDDANHLLKVIPQSRPQAVENNPSMLDAFSTVGSTFSSAVGIDDVSQNEERINWQKQKFLDESPEKTGIGPASPASVGSYASLSPEARQLLQSISSNRDSQLLLGDPVEKDPDGCEQPPQIHRAIQPLQLFKDQVEIGDENPGSMARNDNLKVGQEEGSVRGAASPGAVISESLREFTDNDRVVEINYEQSNHEDDNTQDSETVEDDDLSTVEDLSSMDSNDSVTLDNTLENDQGETASRDETMGTEDLNISEDSAGCIAIPIIPALTGKMPALAMRSWQDGLNGVLDVIDKIEDAINGRMEEGSDSETDEEQEELSDLYKKDDRSKSKNARHYGGSSSRNNRMRDQRARRRRRLAEQKNQSRRHRSPVKAVVSEDEVDSRDASRERMYQVRFSPGTIVEDSDDENNEEKVEEESTVDGGKSIASGRSTPASGRSTPTDGRSTPNTLDDEDTLEEAYNSEEGILAADLDDDDDDDDEAEDSFLSNVHNLGTSPQKPSLASHEQQQKRPTPAVLDRVQKIESKLSSNNNAKTAPASAPNASTAKPVPASAANAKFSGNSSRVPTPGGGTAAKRMERISRSLTKKRTFQPPGLKLKRGRSGKSTSVASTTASSAGKSAKSAP